MAGIGFTLQRLADSDRFSAKLHGFTQGVAVSSGPWLVTFVSLMAIELLSRPLLGRSTMQQFSILTVYNFSFSLVLSGPVVLVVTRCLSDALYADDTRSVPSLLVGGLAMAMAAAALAAAPLYGWIVALSPAARLYGATTLLMAAGLWVAAAVVLALKSYASITVAFIAGAMTAVASAASLGDRFGLTGLLAAFMLGLAVTFFVLVGRILLEFQGTRGHPADVVKAFGRYAQLAWVGLLYNAAIWVDKWIMWAAPGAVAPAPALLANPAYEGAMLLGYLSVVPAMALFIIDIETRFYTAYLRFYRDIGEHATLVEITANHAAMSAVMAQSLRRVVALQGLICVAGLLVGPALIRAAGGGIEMIPIFRYAIVGAAAQLLLIMTMTVLAYFDLRQELLGVAALFLALNTALTALAIWLGPEYAGYGYALSAWLSFAVAFMIARARVAKLPYLTFVANNPALRARSMRDERLNSYEGRSSPGFTVRPARRRALL